MMSSARSFEDDGVQQLCQPHADKTVSASADTCTTVGQCQPHADTTVSASRWHDSVSLTTMSASRWHDTFTLTVLRNHGAWPCLAWETGNGERFHRSDWQSLQLRVTSLKLTLILLLYLRHQAYKRGLINHVNQQQAASSNSDDSVIHRGVDFRSGVYSGHVTQSVTPRTSTKLLV